MKSKYKKKKNNSQPKRWRYKRTQRLLEGKNWLQKYEGKKPISGYARHFRCGALCAAEELKMLGLDIDENVIKDLRHQTKRKSKKLKILKDSKGEYIRETYFINGKMKFRKIYVINGIPVDEFYELNADPITLKQDGEYEKLHEIEF